MFESSELAIRLFLMKVCDFYSSSSIAAGWPADHYLPDTMSHVLSCVKKEKERTAAFQALGLLSVAVRSEFQVYLPKVLEIIKGALPLKDFTHK